MSSGQWDVSRSDYATAELSHKTLPHLASTFFSSLLVGLLTHPLSDLRSYMLIPGPLCRKDPPLYPAHKRTKQLYVWATYLRQQFPSPRTSPVAQTVKRLPTLQETWVQSLGREHLQEKKWQPTPVFLPGKSHGLRILVGYSPRGRKESDTTEPLHSLNLYQLAAVCHCPREK